MQRKRDTRVVGFDLPSAKKQTERVVEEIKFIIKDKMDPSKNSALKKEKKKNKKKGKKEEGKKKEETPVGITESKLKEDWKIVQKKRKMEKNSNTIENKGMIAAKKVEETPKNPSSND